MRWPAAALAVVVAAACAREPEPVPPPPPNTARAPDSGGLQPLTSRDPGSGPASPPAAALPPGHPPLGSKPAAAGAAIAGRVELTPSLAGRSGAALFVIARSAKTQQIVAVRKEEAGRFPLSFSISGADAMTDGTSFEGPLDITARLSQSGDAVPAKGDVEGVARGLAPGARDVRIVLDAVRQ